LGNLAHAADHRALIENLKYRRVVATDYDERSLDKLHKNVSHFSNSDPIRAKVMKVHQLAWGHALDEFRERVNRSYECDDSNDNEEQGYFDVIIGSDIVYYAAALGPMMRTVSSLLTPASLNSEAVFVLANNVNRFGPNREAFEVRTEHQQENPTLDNFHLCYQC